MTRRPAGSALRGPSVFQDRCSGFSGFQLPTHEQSAFLGTPLHGFGIVG
jgi:hypothetical protein